MSLLTTVRAAARTLALAILALGAFVATTANAAPGYWRLVGFTQVPSDAVLAEARPLPGHVHQVDTDIGFGGGGGRININFLTDDADLRQMEARTSFNFSADRDLTTLIPGQRVTFSGAVEVSANALAAPITSAGARVSIDNGDYVFQANARPGQPARGSGQALIPDGGPGQFMVIHFSDYLGQLGAVNITIDARYEFVAGQAPSGSGPSGNSGGDGSGFNGPGPGGGPGAGPGPGGPQPSGPAQTFSDNWNTGGCGTTDTAVLVVNQPTRLDRVEIWYHWSQGESQVGFTVEANGRSVGSGFLTRGACDPYQTAWCVAQGWGGRVLQPGRYRFRLNHPQICQNGGSGGQGFVRGVGWPAASSGGSGPGTGSSGIGGGNSGAGGYGSGSFDGAWNTSEGAMTIRQSGSRFTSTYGGDNGRIEATVQGATATGYWAEDGSAQQCPTMRLGSYFWGRIVWTLSPNGQHFEGRWSYCNAEPGSPWTGDRTGAVSGGPSGGPSGPPPSGGGTWTPNPPSGGGNYQSAVMIIDVTEGPWQGVWTQRVAGGPFEATWRNTQTGAVANDTLTLETSSGNLRVFYRQGMNGRYYAAVGADGRSLVGTGSWYGARETWTGRIR